jgi:pimeloyl-ACP methyl ester carboxylesterase
MLLFTGGKNIWYTDSGEGDAIILLHGYLESSEVWDSFAEKLAGSFRVICVDLPGHGLSDIYGGTHTMEFMAGVVRDLCMKLSLEKVFLAGHSLGGYVALAFVELFPENLSGYCLFHSHPLPDSPEAIQKRKREITIVEAGKKDIMYPENVEKMFATANIDTFRLAVERSRQIAARIPDEGIIAVLNGMMQRPSRVGVMEKGIVPCLWILGAMDNYIPCDTIRETVKLPVNAKVVVLENSGHMGFVEEESLSVKILTEFAGSLKAF